MVAGVTGQSGQTAWLSVAQASRYVSGTVTPHHHKMEVEAVIGQAKLSSTIDPVNCVAVIQVSVFSVGLQSNFPCCYLP